MYFSCQPTPAASRVRARLRVEFAPSRDCPTLGFIAVRPIVGAMLADLESACEGAAWRPRIRPELVFLFPALADHPAYRDAPALADIAVGPSRRRLHKESEQIFRVTQAVVEIILGWAAVEAPQGVDFVFHDLTALDEQSLRVFLRLSHCAASSETVTVSARLVARENAEADIAGAPVLAPLLCRARTRRTLIERLRQEIPATIEAVSAAIIPAATFPVPALESTEEGRLTARFTASLTEVDPDRQGADLLAALEASVFTQNHDHALWLVEQAVPIFPHLSAAVRREVLIHLGMLHAFMMDFPLALQAMEASAAEARTPREQAESCFFAGLLLIKRMNRIEEGRARLQQALVFLAGRDSAAECCERAWIYNVMALSYATEKNFRAARRCCQQVLANLKTAAHTPDATHLKINVISNITMLDEFERNIEGALAHWSFFDGLLAKAGPIFNKHFLFRKGGLLARAGRWDEAMETLLRCHAQAEGTGDVFYGDVIAQGIAGIAYRRGDFAVAAEWYRKSLDAKAALLEDADTGRVRLALGLAQSRAGDFYGARLSAAKRRAAAGHDPDIEQALDQLRAGAPDRIDPAVAARATALPETKLNRPFRFTNLH